MTRSTLLPLLLSMLLLLLVAAQTVRAIHWEHAAQLNDDFRLLWNIKGADITFEMQVRTHGYIGLGLARSGDSRTGADLVVGWVDRGQTFFQDRHMKANDVFEPSTVDSSQDYKLLLGYENVTHTVMRFVRRLDTCDDPDDVPIGNDTMRLILVYHADDPRADAAGQHLPGALLSDAQMAIRAVVPLRFTGRTQGSGSSGGGSGSIATARRDERVLELRAEGVALPAVGELLEWCRVFELNEFSTKHHMVRYEPVFGTEQGRRQLDALVLYECQGGVERLQRAVRVGGGPCAEFRPTRGVVCEAVVASWTRGSAGLNFPPEAGYPFDSHKERFYLMESHYSGNGNADAIPEDLATAFDANAATPPPLDNSGLRLHVTAVLRPHDAGVLSIGMSPDWRHIIPPGQRHVISEGHCVDECTRRSLPADGIRIFALVMQTHSIGTQVRVRQVRANTELPPIASDAGVHETYAEYARIEPPAHVAPGDNLIVECTYDSAGREAITLGSQSPRGESCQVLAVYWPRQKRMTRCLSLPSLPTVLHSLGIDELASGSQPVLIAAPVELAGMTLESRLLGYDWAKQFGMFQRVTRGGSFEAICMNARHKSVPGTDAVAFHRPRVTKSLVAVDGATSAGGAGRCAGPADQTNDDAGLENGLEAPQEYVTLMGDRAVESMGLSGATRAAGVWCKAVMAALLVVIACAT